MGFVQRAFTPPGTGGAEAAAIQAQANAQQAAKAAQAAATAAIPAPPTLPTAPAPAAAPPQFSPGQAPGAKQRAQITASTMLGAAAASGQTAKKSLLGQ